MTRDQQNIIWLGLILIALNIIVNLADFKTVIFNKDSGPAGNAGASAPVPTPGNSNPPVAPGPMSPIYGNGNQPQNTPPSVMVA